MCHSAVGNELICNKKGFPTSNLSEKTDVSFYQEICPVFYYNEQCIHDIWGKYNKSVVAYSSNSSTRFKAASGGALTELCAYLLENKYVDGIIHTTFDNDDTTKNITCVSTTRQELIERCGSRYSISVPLDNILQIAKSNKKYAFVGKPCDVMALRRYINYKPKYKEVFVCLLSFFCAGEPSVNAQKKLLMDMGSSTEKCKKITYRGNGWPGFTTVENKDGSIKKIEYKYAWGRYLGRDLRDACRYCMDGTGDSADLVCADFWQLDENEHPDFSEHDGRNIVISRSDFGKRILDGTIKAGGLDCECDFTNNMDELHKYQPNHFMRKSTMKTFLFTMKLFGRNVPEYSKSYLSKFSKNVSFGKKAHFFVGTTKRIIKKKL